MHCTGYKRLHESAESFFDDAGLREEGLGLALRQKVDASHFTERSGGVRILATHPKLRWRISHTLEGTGRN
jgi:hypothetical protein